MMIYLLLIYQFNIVKKDNLIFENHVDELIQQTRSKEILK